MNRILGANTESYNRTSILNLRGCTGSSEPWLLADAIGTKTLAHSKHVKRQEHISGCEFAKFVIHFQKSMIHAILDHSRPASETPVARLYVLTGYRFELASVANQIVLTCLTKKQVSQTDAAGMVTRRLTDAIALSIDFEIGQRFLFIRPAQRIACM